MDQKSLLLSTLGTEPQVVTLALHALKQKHPSLRISEVWVIHTAPKEPAIEEALSRLKTAFQEDPRLSEYSLQTIPIASAQGRRYRDLESLQAVKATFRTLYITIKRAKEQGFQVHLSVAGGRKPMAIFGIVAAQLLFDDQDRAWHLISSKSLMESRSLFPESREDWVRLVPIPIIPWSDVDPILTVIAREEDPFEAADLAEVLRKRRRQNALRLFVEGKLSPAERRVLRHVVERGGTLAEIARALKRSPRTVEHQLQSIYRKIKDHQDLLHLDIPQNTKLTRDALVRLFGEVFG